ncbi:MerR family DNA-binding transcriptional regulator, partial [Streptomyces buecherae]|uniref:MerR family DNA-binding transcriptional regulator n=1 Tax=Streptomyces buecherae TaxID=2763006 RepID=UPI001C2746E4
RYYEQQGLLAPERAANGYREYGALDGVRAAGRGRAGARRARPAPGAGARPAPALAPSPARSGYVVPIMIASGPFFSVGSSGALISFWPRHRCPRA